MNIVKSFSLLIVGSLLSTTVLAQNATPQPQMASEPELKPLVAQPIAERPIANTIPAPGARVVAETPPEVLKMEEQREKAMRVQMEAAPEAVGVPQPTVSPASRAIDIQEAKKMQAVALDATAAQQVKLTEEQKATMQGSKAIRPRTIDQTTGATESKLTPITPMAIPKPVIAAPTPIKEN